MSAFVKSNFPGVKVLSVNPTTGYVTVDLSGADGRAKRLLRDAGDNTKSYYLYTEPGKSTATLQVIGSPNQKGDRRRL